MDRGGRTSSKATRPALTPPMAMSKKTRERSTHGQYQIASSLSFRVHIATWELRGHLLVSAIIARLKLLFQE